jgi:hypothetical protein
MRCILPYYFRSINSGWFGAAMEGTGRPQSLSSTANARNRPERCVQHGMETRDPKPHTSGIRMYQMVETVSYI